MTLRMTTGALLLAALSAFPLQANEASLLRSGSIRTLSISQSPGGGHVVGGVSGGPARLTGDFESVRIEQRGPDGRVGLDLMVGHGPSRLDLATDGAAEIEIRGVAASLSSRIVSDGGPRDVAVEIVAPGHAAWHDLSLSGPGDMSVRLWQGPETWARADVTAFGRAEIGIEQTGFGARADLSLRMDDDARFDLRQSGAGVRAAIGADIGTGGSFSLQQRADGVSARFDAVVGPGASLAIDQAAPGIDLRPGGMSFVVAPGHSVSYATGPSR